MTNEYETMKADLLVDLTYLAAGTKTLEELERLAEKMVRAYIARISAEKQEEE